MAWEKINEMFPEGYAITNQGHVSNEEIVVNNPDCLHVTLHKPVRNMTEWEEQVYWYSNGDMQRFYTYHVLPFGSVDNRPLLNVYAQKFYNDFCKENTKKEEKK